MPVNMASGGFSLTSGRAWRWEISTDSQGQLSLNLLEFSCWLAEILDTTKACSYSQWIAGDDNVIADALSRDHHLSTPRLTQLLLHSATHQMPPNFSILPIPSDIASRLTSWTQIGRAPKDFTLTPKRSSIASFASGSNFSHPLDSVTLPTHSWSTCPQNNVHDSLEPSPMRSGKPSAAHIETHLWHQQQSMTPSHLCQQPFWNMTDPTPLRTYTAKLTAFYVSSSPRTEIPIQPLNTNAH